VEPRVKYATGIITKAPTDGSGTFTALVSTFGGDPDAQGDVVDEGAFTKTIADWRGKGRFPPVFWTHGVEDPTNAVGVLTSMAETREGLVVDGKLNLAKDRAVSVYEGLLDGSIQEFSIGYSVHEQFKDADGVNHLAEVELLEVSIVVSGANRHTRLLSVKSRASAGQMAAMARMSELLDQMLVPAPKAQEYKSGPLDRETYEALASMFKWAETYEEYLADLASKAPGAERPKQAPSAEVVGRRPIPEFDGRFAVKDDAPTQAGPAEAFSADVLDAPDGQPVQAQISEWLESRKSPAVEAFTEAAASAQVLQAAAAHLTETASRAQGAGLADTEAALMQAARDLVDVSNGRLPAEDVASVITSVQDAAVQLLEAGQTVAADNLIRVTRELYSGVTGAERVPNAEHLTGTSR